jgi:hydroxymethylbilane synthase
LAAAGVKRLGLPLTGVLLEVDVMLPAVGQGIIGCEARETDARTRELLAAINDAGTRACAEAERSFLHAIGGGCQLPYAAHATVTGNELCLVAARFAEDGTSARRATVTGPVADARAVGERAAVEIRG